MSTTIQRIESVGPDARARRLVFDDASESRVTAASVLKALSLQEGSVVDPQELCVALAEHEPRLARERALQLLGYRERSRTELLERLLVNGFPREVAESVVERFCEVELVDDSRFASAWIRTRVSAGYGRRRIARELAEKGVDDHLIQSALDDEIHGDEAYRARDSLRGRRPRDAKDRERLIRRLVSRGFELRVALEAVDTVEQD